MEDRRLFFMFHQIQRKLQKFADRIYLKAIGVSSVQVATIFYLKKHEGCLLKDLSTGLKMNNSAVTGLVSRMEKQGLVSRRKSSGDGRATQVFLTDKANRLTGKAIPILASANEMIQEDFSEDEMAVVMRFLNAIISLDEEKELERFRSFFDSI